MKKLYKLLASLLISSLVVVGIIYEKSNKKTPLVSSNRTQVRIVNESKDTITVYVTLGAVQGCITNVAEIPYITNVMYPLCGYFTLLPGDSTQDWAPSDSGYCGNVTVNTQPINCPTTQFPSGVNIFEFNIDNTLQIAPNAQETVDISCVAGVSCVWSGDFYNAGSEKWTANSVGYDTVTHIQNSTLSDNKGRVGVYPFCCDDCTSMSGQCPQISCIPVDTNSKDHQTKAICMVQRNAIGSTGGILRAVYKGKFEICK